MSLCSTCRGVKTIDCPICRRVGKVNGKICPNCQGVKKVTCPTCRGTGK